MKTAEYQAENRTVETLCVNCNDLSILDPLYQVRHLDQGRLLQTADCNTTRQMMMMMMMMIVNL